ncbi:hypothetical protein F5888DRAFT_1640630 [Russula emetica]|nr:hypothetical protein F5888DRAFT_1640630 [Russula emetica]
MPRAVELPVLPNVIAWPSLVTRGSRIILADGLQALPPLRPPDPSAPGQLAAKLRLSNPSPAIFAGPGTSEQHIEFSLRGCCFLTYPFTFGTVVVNDRECKGERPTSTQRERQNLESVKRNVKQASLDRHLNLLNADKPQEIARFIMFYVPIPRMYF